MLPAPAAGKNRSARSAGLRTPFARNAALLATLSLLAGLFFYLLCRPGGSVALLPAAWHLAGASAPGYWPAIGQSLPSLLHVYGFCLLSAALPGPMRHRAWTLGAFWCALEVLLELSQLATVRESITRHIDIPTGFSLANATFDPLDLVAIVTGAVAAVLSIQVLQSICVLHHHKETANAE